MFEIILQIYELINKSLYSMKIVFAQIQFKTRSRIFNQLSIKYI